MNTFNPEVRGQCVPFLHWSTVGKNPKRLSADYKLISSESHLKNYKVVEK